MRHTAKNLRQDPFGIDVREEAPADMEMSHPAFTKPSSFDEASHNQIALLK